MLFNDENILIFHPGKCGGTTIEHLFLLTLQDTNLAAVLSQPCFNNANNRTLSDACRQERLEFMTGYLRQEFAANGVGNIYLQHADITATLRIHNRHKIDGMFKITFVRNPFPRLLSAYYYNMLDRKMSFREFVLKRLPVKYERNDPYTRNHFGDLHRYTHLDGRLYVDFVGKLENIANDVATLAQLLNMDLELNREHQHARTVSSERYAHYSQAYDDEMVEVVETLFARDLALFDYSFERRVAYDPSPRKRSAAEDSNDGRPAILKMLRRLINGTPQ